MAWTLSINGTSKTLAEWGVERVVLEKANLTPDRLTFNFPMERFDDDELCAFGDEVELLRDGVRWFWGTRQLVDGQCLAESESQNYLFAGPLRWLVENPFQQLWFGPVYTSHVIINQSIGQNIKRVLDYAIANGAILQYVQAELDFLTIFPPANESTGQPCDHAIGQNLQFAPDVIGWVDYSTTPPTFHLKSRPRLTAAGVRLASYDNEALPPVIVQALRSRPDLQLPSAKINFETIVTIDGVEFLVPSVDIWPLTATGREDGVFTDTITLRGRTETNLFGELECEQIPNLVSGGAVNQPTLAWLKKHINTWQDGRVSITRINSIRRLDEDGNLLPLVYARELPPGGGTIAPWMRYNDGSRVAWQREFFEVNADYFEFEDPDDDEPIKGGKQKIYRFEITTTDAPGGLSQYSARESVDYGDQPITGLARFLYEALNPLQYEGVFQLREQECSGFVDLGTVLNLFGSRGDYETMRAVVQQVVFDIDNGATQIQCGPPRHLTLGDLIALHERFRVNRRWTNPDTQDTGEVGGSESGNLEIGRASGNTNALPGAGVTEHMVIKTAGDATEKFIQLSMDDMEDSWVKKNIKLRRLTVCIRNAQGITQDYNIIVPCSEPWPIA